MELPEPPGQPDAPDSEHPDPPALRWYHLVPLSIMWLGLYAVSGALFALIVPLQVEDLLRQQALGPTVVEAQKSSALGGLLAAGSFVALIVPLGAGLASDYATSRFGRRRPYILGGTVLALIGLLGMAAPSSLLIYGSAYLLHQVGYNTALAACQGLIPDRVPSAQRGQASGWLVGMTVLGQVGGLLIAQTILVPVGASGLLPRSGQQAVYGILALVLGACTILTLTGVHEIPQATAAHTPTWPARLRSLWINPHAHHNFAWVWITRFLMTWGFSLGSAFLVYFLQDAVGIPSSQVVNATTSLYLGLLLTTLLAALLGGRLSDRLGRKPLVYGSGVLMAFVFFGFVAARGLARPGPFLPLFNTILYFAIALGVGYGAYQAVDWALATDTLPDRAATAARDLGIWHVAIALPQSLATAAGGLILTLTTTAGWPPTDRYGLLFGISGIFLIAGTLFVRQVHGIR